jgi:hypothetical protein
MCIVANEADIRFNISPFDPATAAGAELRDYFELTNDIINEEDPELPTPEYDAYVGELRNPVTYMGPRRFWIARHQGHIVGRWKSRSSSMRTPGTPWW